MYSLHYYIATYLHINIIFNEYIVLTMLFYLDCILVVHFFWTSKEKDNWEHQLLNNSIALQKRDFGVSS